VEAADLGEQGRRIAVGPAGVDLGQRAVDSLHDEIVHGGQQRRRHVGRRRGGHHHLQQVPVVGHGAGDAVVER